VHGLQPFENMQRQSPVRRHRPDIVRAVFFFPRELAPYMPAGLALQAGRLRD
jgi:hypothetical protein